MADMLFIKFRRRGMSSDQRALIFGDLPADIYHRAGTWALRMRFFASSSVDSDIA